MSCIRREMIRTNKVKLLKDYKTCELVKELKEREGVIAHWAEPYEDKEVKINGPCAYHNRLTKFSIWINIFDMSSMITSLRCSIHKTDIYGFWNTSIVI